MPTITGTAGSDLLVGGAGNDTLDDDDGGADILRGEGGNDHLIIRRQSNMLSEAVSMEGGDGDDTFTLQAYNASTILMDGGAGADLFNLISTGGGTTITTGSGIDTISFNQLFSGSGSITVTDFSTGIGGDRIDWSNHISGALSNWNGGNPFASGHMRLLQSGSDTLLQIDSNGGGNAYSTFITFRNTQATTFTTQNLGGFPPDGSSVPGQTITGTSASDNLIGSAGNDTLNGLGGGDSIRGGAGDDLINGGDGDDSLHGELGSDVVFGGAGNDTLDDDDGGADILRGEGGNDHLIIRRQSNMLSEAVSMEGGDGDDTFTLQAYNASTILMDGGAGADLFNLISTGGGTTITTGSGIDTISFNQLFSGSGSITVTDFSTGIGGDRIDWSNHISGALSNWNGGNPFASGHMRLLQSGSDTLLQIDSNGGGNAYSTFITFRNTQATTFTTQNLGFSVFNYVGGTSATDSLIGTNGSDSIVGAGGNDTLAGGAGSDTLDGGSGVDVALYTGVRRQYVASSSSVAGGPEGGTDSLTSIESARFVDGSLSFDVNGVPAQIMRLYDAALDRQPDQGGYENLLDYMEGGGSLSVLATAFLNSAEFQARYGGLSNQQFVEQMYRFCLDREGDPGGIQSWVNNLNTGTTRTEMLVLFSESAEHRTLTQPILNQGLWVANDQALTIARLYDATFDRLPDSGGLAGWTANLAGGQSLVSIAAAFASSQEFQDRYGSLSNQQFVEQMYRFCLDREGDPAGISGWVNNMNNGLSRAEVLMFFSESAEHVALTRPLWLGGVRTLDAPGAAPVLADEPAVKGADEAQVLIAADDDLIVPGFKAEDDAFVIPALEVTDTGPEVLIALDEPFVEADAPLWRPTAPDHQWTLDPLDGGLAPDHPWFLTPDRDHWMH
jgi:Ca2+-binding RTX toxin-like protein